MHPPWRTSSRKGTTTPVPSVSVGPPAAMTAERGLQLVVDPVPRSVAQARRFIRAAADRAAPDRLERAAVCGSELVANAVVHGEPPIVLTVWSRGDRILVAVSDTSPTPPAPRTARASEPDGRGTLIVGRLADRWGVDFPDRGKRVWCLIGQPSA